MENSSNKRKATSEGSNSAIKKQKNWQTPKQANRSKAGKEIHIGDAGIWVTCNRGREVKAAAEIVDLLGEYAQRLYDGITVPGTDIGDGTDEDEPSDIEQAISSELSHIKSSRSNSKSLFTVIRPDIECVVFIKTRPPVDPVLMVHTICKEIASGTAPNRCRFVKRLTPATSTEKAQERNFEDLAKRLLKPVFHEDDSGSKKFMIRFSSRNNNILARNEVIKATAALVGTSHKVDLEHPEVIILIEIYKNICTMAVVTGEFNNLKKYNLSEIVGNREQESSDGKSRFRKADESENPERRGPEDIASENSFVEIGGDPKG